MPELARSVMSHKQRGCHQGTTRSRRIGLTPRARYLLLSILCIALSTTGSTATVGATTAGPYAQLEASPSAGGVPLYVNFNGANSFGNAGTIASWDVSFGDGTPDSSGSGAPGADIGHTYDSSGSFTAMLTVTNRSGLTATSSVPISVGPTDNSGGATDAVQIAVTGSPITGISSSPLPLKPTFRRADTDYVWYCAAGTNSLTVDIQSKGTITADGQSGSSLSIPLTVSNNQAAVVDAPNGQQYWIRCLPATFPHITAKWAKGAPSGYYVTGTFKAGPRGIPGYPIVLNSYGTPVWYLTGLPFSGDNVEVIPGQDQVAWSNHGPYSLYSPASRAVSYLAPPVDPPDPHELYTDSQGNSWMISIPVKSGYDLTSLGYSESDIVNCVVQELDSSGKVIWSWDASEHVSPLESNKLRYVMTDQGQQAVDVYHCNSVDVDPANTNNILISMREIGVVLVDKTTGTIQWKIGGTKASNMDGEPDLTTQGDPEGTIQGQHDARFAPNGDISMFDDHTGLTGAARAIEYNIDSNSDTASMVWQYAAPSGHNTSRMGSARRYDSAGSTYDQVGSAFAGPSYAVIDWGQGAPTAGMSVVDNTGNVLLNVQFEKGYVGNRGTFVPLSALNLSELRNTAGTPFP